MDKRALELICLMPYSFWQTIKPLSQASRDAQQDLTVTTEKHTPGNERKPSRTVAWTLQTDYTRDDVRISYSVHCGDGSSSTEGWTVTPKWVDDMMAVFGIT